jgi:hypothetical protein
MMADEEHISKVAALGQQVSHILEALTEIKAMILAMRTEYVRKDHHDFKVSALEDRVAAIERQREEERRSGGMLNWWVNVTKVFAGFAVICTVLGTVAALAIRIAGPK